MVKPQNQGKKCGEGDQGLKNVSSTSRLETRALQRHASPLQADGLHARVYIVLLQTPPKKTCRQRIAWRVAANPNTGKDVNKFRQEWTSVCMQAQTQVEANADTWSSWVDFNVKRRQRHTWRRTARTSTCQSWVHIAGLKRKRGTRALSNLPLRTRMAGLYTFEIPSTLTQGVPKP